MRVAENRLRWCPFLQRKGRTDVDAIGVHTATEHERSVMFLRAPERMFLHIPFVERREKNGADASMHDEVDTIERSRSY